MTMISILQMQSRDAYPALIAGLEAQFGARESVGIACLFFEAECADFHWESRVMERHLGRWEGENEDDGEGIELDRIAISGVMRGAWYTAICVVDGDGAVHHMTGLRLVQSAAEAQAAIDRAH